MTNKTIEIGSYKIEDIDRVHGGGQLGKLYEKKVDDHGREYWLCAGGIEKTRRESWQAAIDRVTLSD